MDALSERHLGHTPIPFKEVIAKAQVADKKEEKTFAKVPVKDATEYCGRGRRRHAAAVDGAEAAAGAGADDDGLRDAGAAADAGAGRDGAGRHQG